MSRGKDCMVRLEARKMGKEPFCCFVTKEPFGN